MKLKLYCTVMEIVIPKLMTLLARKDHWSGALLVQCDGIPSPVVPLTKGRLDIFFHICLNELLNEL